ncbi:MAG TPA: hypothetical protein VME66_08190 [Candidatus Acidoferrales bacterium]|nr:hypothetical protein [Candidatus Acidoferrales bacterium]
MLRATLIAALMLNAVGVAMSEPAPKLQWIINGPALRYFAADAFARRFFEGTQPLAIRRQGEALLLPDAWGAQEVRSFTSYRAIAAAFANGTIGSGVRAILYDNEAWTFTPRDEQRQCVEFAQRAAQLVHSHGLLFIATPAVDLVRAYDPMFSGKRYDRFLQLGIIGGVARFADIVDIQAQGSERSVATYSAFVRAAAAQARAANPRVRVFAGISTNPNGQSVTADQILGAIRATSADVDGYWFNVPAPSPYCPRCNAFRPDLAVEVLRGLSE